MRFIDYMRRDFMYQPPEHSLLANTNYGRRLRLRSSFRHFATLGTSAWVFTGMDSGFLERGFIYMGVGVRFADIISGFLTEYPMKLK